MIPQKHNLTSFNSSGQRTVDIFSWIWKIASKNPILFEFWMFLKFEKSLLKYAWGFENSPQKRTFFNSICPKLIKIHPLIKVILNVRIAKMYEVRVAFRIKPYTFINLQTSNSKFKVTMFSLLLTTQKWADLADQKRWYYNPTTLNCEQFLNGGCDGNYDICAIVFFCNK